MIGSGVGALPIHESPDGISFAVKVIPRATRDQIVGMEGDALKVRLAAPPAEGRANAALIKLLAKVFGIGRADVEIIRGRNTRQKLVRVRGLTSDKVSGVLKQI